MNANSSNDNYKLNCSGAVIRLLNALVLKVLSVRREEQTEDK